MEKEKEGAYNNMSLINDIKKGLKGLFKRDSFNSNVGYTKTKTNRLSLKLQEDHITYETGRKILKDTQVSTGFDILKYVLSSKQWVLVANENDTDNQVYDFIHNMLFNMETELNEIVKQQITAILWGHSEHEIIYDVDADGRLYVRNIIPIHIKTLQNEPFVYNKDGELTHIHQEWDKVDVDIPINKILKYTFNASFDEDQGNGLLLDFKPIVEDKMNINDWLMSFLEQHENPVVYGKTDDPTSRDAILGALMDIEGGDTRIVVGLNDELGVLESSHRGETFFSTLQRKDNEIFRRYYLGNLLLGDNSQTGTYAQSQTQLEFGSIVFDGLLEENANGFQRQVINRIVEWNFGDISLAPTISFDKFTSGDLEKLFNIIKPLMDSGVVDGENKTVQDSIALLFKKETGLQYVNEEPDMDSLGEEFDLPPTPDDTGTTEILDNILDGGVDGASLTDDILNEVT